MPALPRRLVGVLASFLLGATFASAETVVVHDLSVGLTPDQHRLRATDTLVVPREACAADGLHFLLHAGLRLVSITADGKPIEPGACATHGFAGPPAVTCRVVPLPAGAPALDLAVTYEGEIHDPPRQDETLRFVVGDQTSGTIGPEGVYLHGGTYWYPVPVAPSAAPLLQHFDVEIAAPAGWHGVGQGHRVRAESTEQGNVSRWENPVTCDGLSIVAGPYKVAQRECAGITVMTFLFAEDHALSGVYLDAAEKFLRFFSDLLTPYPYRQFSIVENFFPTGYGMPGYTLLGSDVVKMAERHTGAGGLGHDILHCWWGNYVIAGESAENWCEGLTTYCANYLYEEFSEGEEAAREYRRHTATRFTVLAPPGHDYPVRQFVGQVTEIDDEVGYGKCSMIFHMVRRMLGDPKFFIALKDILRSHGGRHAGWDDFRAAFERSGGRPLGDFFAQWLDRPGAPVLGHLTIGYTQVNDGPYSFRITVDQMPEALATAPGQELPAWKEGSFRPWVLSLPVRLWSAQRTTDTVLELQGDRGTLVLTLQPDELPDRVEVDPDHHVFRRLQRRELPPSLNLTLNAAKKAVVLPAGGDAGLLAAYHGIAEHLRGLGGWDVVEAADASPDVLGRGSLLLLGGADSNPVVKDLSGRLEAAICGHSGAAGPPETPFEFTGTGMKCGAASSDAPKGAGLVSLHNPWGLDHTVTVFVAADAAGAARPARLLFHYGWDGWLVWSDGQVTGRGSIARRAEPMCLDFVKR